jgi:hypothetical protein
MYFSLYFSVVKHPGFVNFYSIRLVQEANMPNNRQTTGKTALLSMVVIFTNLSTMFTLSLGLDESCPKCGGKLLVNAIDDTRLERD